ncbi:addiction module toxin, RelE/StbE family [Selenomonas sp. oral taxon 137 str. F0430]|jgi:addiction module toxin, relE/stbE family|uniref:type II toxin-antitoxin system YafQ family toxin n=1 Tax=unclassified Selenomonas TaxID=2637378 RepID=UPI0001EB2203|nr:MULTISPECIES: type II toxin-antitoxin system YafQ family toxin [unclassified Selenomonas]EFR42068.1 addiction module toxin, RelE/StbE family [Selenomonas sp. oral taxon 137 str. F0430]EJP28819.1 addiction module toxin, RelE/StbE family [Selenomonas sp. FOBRC9]
MLEIKLTGQFKKDLKRIEKRRYDLSLLTNVVNALARGEKLASRYRDHALTGNFKGYRECHIAPDWLLIYFIRNNQLVLTLSRTGTHADLLNI